MTVELTEEEKTLILNLLATPVTISPAQMTAYKALVDGIEKKLKGE